jgi:hypothetical protein
MFRTRIRQLDQGKRSTKTFGHRATDNRIAEADARNIARGINPLKRKTLVCLSCSRSLLSKQGLFVKRVRDL